MSKTVIECKDSRLLGVFKTATGFLTEARVIEGAGWILIEDPDGGYDNATWVLNEDGLRLKHTGVEV